MIKNIYFDAAASAQKPQSVIDAELDFLQNGYANSGRGVCARAANVDEMVKNTRAHVAKFIGAESSDQIVFTSGTTDGMNRIVRMLELTHGGMSRFKTVVVSDLDHHSARMPWEQAAIRNINPSGLIVAPLDNDFNIDISGIDKKIDVLVITAMSNVLGMPQNVKKIIETARANNPRVITIVDAAQYVAHLPIDVTDLDCDFLCFSGHKIGADTGLGIMYIKKPTHVHTDKFGGGMIISASGTMAKSNSVYEYMPPPEKFEAGTLPLTQIAGLIPAIAALEKNLCNNDLIKYLYDELSKINRIKIITKPDAYILTFTVDDMHAFDFGAIMGAHGICLRVGTMCASWIHATLGLTGSIRISVDASNTKEQADHVISLIKKVLK